MQSTTYKHIVANSVAILVVVGAILVIRFQAAREPLVVRETADIHDILKLAIQADKQITHKATEGLQSKFIRNKFGEFYGGGWSVDPSGEMRYQRMWPDYSHCWVIEFSGASGTWAVKVHEEEARFVRQPDIECLRP